MYIFKIFYCNFIKIFNFLVSTDDGINFWKASAYIILIIYFYILPYLDMANFFTNYLSDIGFKEFMNLYKKCSTKPYSYFAIDATLAWDNPSDSRKIFLEKIQKFIMTIDKIRDQNLQYDINREAAKISTLSSEKLINMKTLQVKGIKKITLKQKLEWLQLTFATVKAGNISENLLNEIRQVIYFSFRKKEFTKKVYDNIIDLLMDTKQNGYYIYEL